MGLYAKKSSLEKKLAASTQRIFSKIRKTIDIIMSWVGQMVVSLWYVQNVLSSFYSLNQFVFLSSKKSVAIIHLVWNYPMICMKNMQHFFVPAIKKLTKKICKKKSVAMSMQVVNLEKSVSSGPSIDNWSTNWLICLLIREWTMYSVHFNELHLIRDYRK